MPKFASRDSDKFSRWFKQNYHQLFELFILSNLIFLGVDILTAHGYNRFHDVREWIPLFFSFSLPVILGFSTICKKKSVLLFYSVVVGSLLIGLLGMYYHLKHFLHAPSVKTIVYSAPFVAPLSYSGLGLLLWINRYYREQVKKWQLSSQILISLGMFGNFIISLLDHSQNDFHHWGEWLSVIASGVGFVICLLGSLYLNASSEVNATEKKNIYLLIYLSLLLQILVGIIGWGWHLQAVLKEYDPNHLLSLFDYAPLFAPLLLVDLALFYGFTLFKK